MHRTIRVAENKIVPKLTYNDYQFSKNLLEIVGSDVSQTHHSTAYACVHCSNCIFHHSGSSAKESRNSYGCKQS